MKKWYDEEYEFTVEVTGFLHGDHTEETNDQRSKKGRNSGMCKPYKEGIFDRGR